MTEEGDLCRRSESGCEWELEAGMDLACRTGDGRAVGGTLYCTAVESKTRSTTKGLVALAAVLVGTTVGLELLVLRTVAQLVEAVSENSNAMKALRTS